MAPDHNLRLTAATTLPTRHGSFRLESFRCDEAGEPHLALSMGLDLPVVPLVRIHSECVTGEVFGSLKCDCDSQLQAAMDRIGREGCGLLIYLRQEGRGIGIENKMRAYALQERGLDTVDANLALGLPVDARSYGPAVALLRRLDIGRCVLLTNNPDKVAALHSSGIRVRRAPLNGSGPAACRDYLEAKRVRLGHDC